MILAQSELLNGVNWLDKGIVVMILGVVLWAFWKVLRTDRQTLTTTITENTEVLGSIRELLRESNAIWRDRTTTRHTETHEDE